MPTPSLLIVPARFKTGRLYSQIPVPVAPSTSSVGDFNVTRATSATRVDPDGLIASVASGIPRLDYFASGGVVGCPALLVEPASTNFVPSGTVFNSLTGISYTNVSSSPAVDISGTVIAKTATGTTDSYPNQVCLTSLPSGSTTYTISRFFKYNGTDLTTSLEFNNVNQWGGTAWRQRVVISAASGVTLGTSTSCTGSVENYGNGWYRVSAKFTTGATPSGPTPVIYLMIVSGSVASGSSFLTALPQLEVGSVATSYIPTTTGSVTRNADVISVTGAVSGSIGQTQGTIYCEFAYFGQPTVRSGPIYLRQGSLRGLSINFNPSASPAGMTFISRNDGGSTELNIVSGALQLGTYYKIAIGYDAGGTAAGGLQASGVVAYVNGVQTAIGGFRVPNAAGLTEFRMYGANSGTDAEAFNGRIRAAALYTTRLTNEELSLMTQP